MVRAVLALLGHKLEDTKEWKQIKPLMTEKLAKEMIALDICADTRKMERCWHESQRYTDGLDLQKVATEVPAVVKLLLKWLEVTRMVHHIAISDTAKAMEEEHLRVEHVGESTKGHKGHGHGHGKGHTSTPRKHLHEKHSDKKQ